MTDSLYVNVLGSATASITGRLCTHPLDTAKARLQAIYRHPAPSTTGSEIRYKGTVDVLKKTFRSEGLSGLYRGLGAVIIGGTPGTVIYLCSYDVAKHHLPNVLLPTGKAENGSEFLLHFSCGMIAETLSCIIYVPVDVVKERMQVQHKESEGSTNRSNRMSYTSSWDALRKISKTEGLSGIYKGYAATLGSFGPFSAFYFVFYERFKYWARLRQSGQTSAATMRDLEKVEIPFPSLLLCSSCAGALASWITSPLDMAKLRLQVQRGIAATTGSTDQALAKPYKGVFDCLKRSFQEQGLPGLFRGAGARVIYTVPSTTITMTAYEKARYMISDFLDT